METIRAVSVALAALEQVPGDPSDLSAVLRDPVDRQALLGARPFGPCESNDPDEDLCRFETSARSALGQHLVEHLDQGRVEAWLKIVDRGVREARFRPILIGGDEYPVRLQKIWDAPPILFRGLPDDDGGSGRSRRLPPTDDPDRLALAIVGGRETTDHVLAATSTVARTVAGTGVRVISGLAAGVDTAAHEGALRAGGITTAVMGTGIELVFPSENAALAGRIARHGVLLSQFPPRSPRTGTTFLRRNCVIAALSDASLVMDGREQSGSRHEAEQAVRYGKPVFLWREALERERWAQEMVADRVAMFVDSPESVLANLR